MDKAAWGGYSPWGPKESDTTGGLTDTQRQNEEKSQSSSPYPSDHID